MDSLGWLVAIHDCLASLISQQIIIKHHATFQLGAPSKSTLKNISMKLQTHDVDTAMHIGTYSWEVMETYIPWHRIQVGDTFRQPLQHHVESGEGGAQVECSDHMEYWL